MSEKKISAYKCTGVDWSTNQWVSLLRGHEWSVWPHEICVDHQTWTYLSNGNHNIVYVNKNKTEVYKIRFNFLGNADSPERSVRLWNLMNPGFLARIVDEGWVAPYFEDSVHPTPRQISDKLIDMFKDTGRILVDAFAFDDDTQSIGNFKCVLNPQTQQWETVCIDIAAALRLDKELECSQASLDFWGNMHTIYDDSFANAEKFYKKHQPSGYDLVPQTTKALLFVQKHYPDLKVEILKGNSQAITDLAMAYVKERKGRGFTGFNIAESALFTEAQLSEQSGYAKQLLEFGYHGEQFRVLYRECKKRLYAPIKEREEELRYLINLQYPICEVAYAIIDLSTNSLQLLLTHHKQFLSVEAANNYWTASIYNQRKHTQQALQETTSTQFSWHEKMMQLLLSYAVTLTMARQVVTAIAVDKEAIGNDVFCSRYLETPLRALAKKTRFFSQTANNPALTGGYTPALFSSSNTAMPEHLLTASLDEVKAFIIDKIRLPVQDPQDLDTLLFNETIAAVIADCDDIEDIKHSIPLSLFPAVEQEVDELLKRQAVIADAAAP